MAKRDRMDEETRLRRAIARGAGMVEVARLLEILDAKGRREARLDDPRLGRASDAIDAMYERWRLHTGHSDFSECDYGVAEELEAVAEGVYGSRDLLGSGATFFDLEEDVDAIVQFKSQGDKVWIGAMLEALDRFFEKKEHAWFGCSWGTGASSGRREVACDCAAGELSLDERRRRVADHEYEEFEFHGATPEAASGWSYYASSRDFEHGAAEWTRTVFVRGDDDPDDADTRAVPFVVGFAPNTSLVVYVR